MHENDHISTAAIQKSQKEDRDALNNPEKQDDNELSCIPDAATAPETHDPTGNLDNINYMQGLRFYIASSL